MKEILKKFIIDNYLLSSGAIKDDESFLENGIIDSIGVIELTNFIQDKFNIKITVPEIVPENLDSLNNLERYITRKLRSSK